jgi:hypothetical protein
LNRAHRSVKILYNTRTKYSAAIFKNILAGKNYNLKIYPSMLCGAVAAGTNTELAQRAKF